MPYLQAQGAGAALPFDGPLVPPPPWASTRRFWATSAPTACTAPPLPPPHAGLGKYEEALGYFRRASELAPGFSFTSANLALTQFQLGQRNEAVKTMRCGICVWGEGGPSWGSAMRPSRP